MEAELMLNGQREVVVTILERLEMTNVMPAEKEDTSLASVDMIEGEEVPQEEAEDQEVEAEAEVEVQRGEAGAEVHENPQGRVVLVQEAQLTERNETLEADPPKTLLKMETRRKVDLEAGRNPRKENVQLAPLVLELVLLNEEHLQLRVQRVDKMIKIMKYFYYFLQMFNPYDSKIKKEEFDLEFCCLLSLFLH